MAASPIFVGTPKFVNLVVNATNGGDPAYINPTTIATLLTITAGGTGGRIDSVYINAVGTNASTAIRFWVDTVGTGGVANRLVHEEQLAATTSSSVAALQNIIWKPGLVLPAASVLRVTLANTALTIGVSVNVEYGEF